MEIPPVDSLLDLSGKVALVTGSGKGIGAGIACRFAEAGASVVLHYQHSAESARQVAQKILAMKRQVLLVQADLTSSVEVERIFSEIIAAFGRLDILVNNAGSYPVTPLLELGLEEWHGVVDANLTSAFLCLQAAARRMIESGQGGAVVNITSIEAQNPAPGHAHYDAAKAGLEQLTRQSAQELGRFGIRVNMVSPGLIWSENLETNWPDGVKRWMASVPLGRLGRPQDVADACLFLASPAARWITGADIRVDGGIMTRQIY